MKNSFKQLLSLNRSFIFISYSIYTKTKITKTCAKVQRWTSQVIFLIIQLQNTNFHSLKVKDFIHREKLRIKCCDNLDVIHFMICQLQKLEEAHPLDMVIKI